MEDRLTSSGRQVDVNRRQVISSAAVAQTTLMSERAIFQGRRRSVQVSPSPATSLRRRRSSFQGPATSAVLQREEGSFRKRRTSVREAAIPLATDDVDELFSQGSSAPSSSVPSFREEWSPVFAEDRYQHMLPSIQGFCWVVAVYFLASSSWKCQSCVESLLHHLLGSAAEFSKEETVQQAKLLFEMACDMGKTLACGSAGIAFALPSLRPFCVRNVDWLCAILVAVLYALQMANPVWQDLQARELTTACAAVGSTDNVRACKEYRAKVRSSALNIDMQLLSIFLCHLPLVLKMHAYQMWVFTYTVLVSHVAALLVAGEADWGLLANLVLSLAMIIPEKIFLRKEETRAKQHFAYIMTIRFASAVHRDLLHTLIPPNVLKFVTDASEAGPNKTLLTTQAQAIPMCTVMFASVIYDVATPEDFDFLSHLFSTFDQAVEQSGMFKYQHVSSGECHYFIITCPCVSNPYQDAGADSYAYAKTYLDMIALGFDLMKITDRVLSLKAFAQADKQREVPESARDVHVKIGISSGPAAGVVLGRCRRFYCVYGDTINTAARMCASSGQEAVRVTADIGQHPSVEKSSWFVSEWLQKVPIKGKGDMDVCDLRIKSESFFEREIPQREALIVRRRVSQDDLSEAAETARRGSGVTSSSGDSRYTLEDALHLTGALQMPSDNASVHFAAKSGAEVLYEIQQLRSSVGPRGPMPLETFKPQFRSVEHEQAFRNSNAQNLKQIESLQGGFIFQLGILFFLCHHAMDLCASGDPVATAPIGSECVGGSRCNSAHREQWLSESQVRSGFIQQAIWIMATFVAISFCLVLCMAGVVHRWIQSVQNAAIRFNLMNDTSMWTDWESEASDFKLVPKQKMSQSRVQLCKTLLCLCKFVCCYSSLLVGLMVPCRRDFLFGLGLGHLQTFGLYGVDFGGTFSLAVAGIPGYWFVYSLGQHSNTYARSLGFNGELPNHYTEDPTFYFRNVLAIIMDLFFANAVWRSERTMWGIEMDYRDRLSQMRTVLLDLLPSAYLHRLLEGCDYIECSSGRAVVLQLDICKFTVLSQQHEPKNLADIVNALICDFDECVLGSIGHMIKIDTIGDAYIVVNWLTPTKPENFSDDKRHTMCHFCLYLDAIIVANNILSVLATFREKTGIDLHVRIGIGTGEVISGVMGRLQPRFCVYGEAMKEAAENERRGLADTVHCSQDFFDVITRDMCSDPCLADVQHKIDGIRLVNRMVQEGTLKVCGNTTSENISRTE